MRAIVLLVLFISMKVLVACEFSSVVREAFKAKGHEALSCDLLPSDIPGDHYQGDVLDLYDEPFDLMIAHPPCTFLCSSGLHWNKVRPDRAYQTEQAIEFVETLMRFPIKKHCIENPVGILSTRIRKPDQIIQPYEYGHDASKRTCLWLQDLPLLIPTQYVPPPRMVNGKGRYSNQTDSGQNNLAPSKDRWAKRSMTYPGIAAAFASQFGDNP